MSQPREWKKEEKDIMTSILDDNYWDKLDDPNDRNAYIALITHKFNIERVNFLFSNSKIWLLIKVFYFFF